MLIIAHRGNMDGKHPELENRPDYLLRALNLGFGIEVDLWGSYYKGELIGHLGHDHPQYSIDANSIILNHPWSYIHCKNVLALYFCLEKFVNGNYFSHDRDDVVLTSNSKFWTYPKSTIILGRNSIPVVFNKNDPIWNPNELEQCYGICTDDAKYYKTIFGIF